MSESEEKEQRDVPATAAPEDQAASEKVTLLAGCPIEMYDDESCGRPIHAAPDHDETDVCLMHSHDPQKSDEAFQEKFEAILKDAGDGIADFTKFVFPRANYREREFTARCLFNDATFRQYAIFFEARFARDAAFVAATFTQGANFSSAAFAGDVDFIGAAFTQDANFFQATFTRDAGFFYAEFRQDASFEEATFTQSADFEKATFTQDAVFSDATFSQDADFRRATFTQKADFNAARFTHVADFRGTKLLGKADFRRTRFRQDQEPLPGPIFSLVEFSQPEGVIFYKTYLGQALFHNCDVSKVNFSSVEWRKRKGGSKRMVLEEEVSPKSHDYTHALNPAADSADERDYGLIAELYQQLKKNYDERKDYWTAGDFHYGEMEMKRLATRRKNKSMRWLVQHFRLVAWYKYASHYGESYVRPALWLFTVLLAFALLFPVAGLRYDAAKDPHAVSGAAPSSYVLTYWHPFPPGQVGAGRHGAQWRLFGNSCVTALDVATFQRDRTYEPAYPWGRLLFLLESLLVPTLFGLFLLAVQRQFRR